MKWIASLLLASFLMGCTATSQPLSQAEARSILQGTVDMALAGNFQGICDMANEKAWCDGEMNTAKLSAPKAPPTIRCLVTLEPQPTDNGVQVGGQLIVVSGVDGKGKPFETDVLVFRQRGKTLIQNPIWWSGSGITRTGQVPSPETWCDT